MRIFRINLFLIFLIASSCATNSLNQIGHDYFSGTELPRLKSDFNLVSTEDRGKRLLGSQTDFAFVLATFVQFEKFPPRQEELNWLRQLNEMSRDSEFSNISFEFVVLNQSQDREALKAIEESLNLKKPFLNDPSQVSGYDSGAKFNLDSVLFYRKTKNVAGTLNISGGADNFKLQLRSILNRKAVAPIIAPSTPAIVYAKTLSHPPDFDYQKEIAPIIIRNCVKCHNEFGVAPWNMNNHASLYHSKKMIREVLLLKRMPPAQSDGHYRRYSNEAKLTEAEIQKIVAWIDQGAPNKSSADPLAALKFEKPKDFRLGEPDLIINLEDQFIGASDTELVKVLKAQWPLEKPVRVKGMDVQTSNIKATHHISNYYIIPGPTYEQDVVAMFDGSYIPGYEPEFLPFNASYLVPAKSPIRLSPHIVPTGKDEVIKMRIGFYFDKTENPNELMHCGIDSREINIPPNAANHYIAAKGTVTEDIRVIQLGAHMHKRGRSIKYSARTPDNKTEVLLSLPNYIHSWQREYQLQEPLFIPKGSTVTCEGYFDNSHNNPRVQDPGKTIRYGWYSEDEMMACSCFAMREADYQRIISKKKLPYSPLPPAYNRDVISRTSPAR